MSVHPDLFGILYNINNPLATKLRTGGNKEVVGLMLEADGSISYIPKKKLVGFDYYSPVGRQSAKLATVLKKLVPDTDENEVRDLVEQFKAFTTKEDYTVEIVDGMDAAEAYMTAKSDLSERAVRGTLLSGACFQGTLPWKRMEMFLKNMDVIKMIVTKYKGKLDGRSLLIHGYNKKDNKPLIFQENAYYGSTQSMHLMRDKVREIGGCYVDRNNYRHYYPDGTQVKDVEFEAKLRRCGHLEYLDCIPYRKFTDTEIYLGINY